VQDIRAQRAVCPDCLLRVESALHRFLPVSEKRAQKRTSAATEKNLAQDYFNRLN